MSNRPPVTSEDVDIAAGTVLDTLRLGLERDWTVPAGSLEWTCFDTAQHAAASGLVYAGQLAVEKREPRYVRLFPREMHEVVPVDVVESIQTAYRLLALAVAGSPSSVRAFHPYGDADSEGFAGGGCIEVLIHGSDIAEGLGLPFHPPRYVCARVLARMFPSLLKEIGDLDPWTGLRIGTGREAPPGQERLVEWRWQSAPFDV